VDAKERRVSVPLFAYATVHPKSRMICEAFAKGAGGKVVGPAPLRPGKAFFYGALRGLLPTLRQAQAEAREWFYADNGYFRPGKGGYFRITRNARQHDGCGNAKPERWERLGLEIKPWRTIGSHILVCPPDQLYGELWGIDVVKWRNDVLGQLERATDRPVVVRDRSSAKDPNRPLAADLANCWALVTCTSNIAVDALIAGVPVFCTHPCSAYDMGTPILGSIEEPIMREDRLRWAQVLAANQWTLPEMSSGLCWRELTS
jgi:hypothetical protein